MGTLITQVKLPKQISLVDWDVTEDGININGTYNYISFPSPITSFPLEGNDIPPAFINEIVISDGSFTAANGTYTRSNSADAFTKTSGTAGAIFFGGDAWYIFSTSIGNLARNTSDLGTGTWDAWAPGNSSGINATYSYSSSSSAATYNLYASENGSEYSLIYSGGTPIVEGYKHSSLESYMFYDGSRWALWFDGTYQWVNLNGTQNILPFNSWEIYVAQGAAGDIQVLDGSTGKNILFLVKKTNAGNGGISTSVLTAGSIYDFNTNSASNGRNFNTIATNENYFDFLLTEMGYVPSVFKAFITSQSGIVIDFSKHAIVTRARTNSPITNINFLNMGNRSMRVIFSPTIGFLPANYFRIYIIDRRGWNNINLTDHSQLTILEDYNFNLNLGGNLEQYWELNEPSGTRVNLVNIHDLVEGDATIPNTIGRINYSADFDAVDNTRYLWNDEFALGETFSISSWVKLHSYNPSNDKAIWGTSAYDPVSSLYISNATNQFQFYNNIIDLTLTTNIVPDLETWYHTVYVVNRNQMYLYINGDLAGVLYTVGTIFTNSSTAGFTLSNYFYDGPGIPGYPINAAIDEVGIWGRMLNESEIKSLYNFGNGLPVENFYT